MNIEAILLEYTQLAREFSELPVNAESAEAYAPVAARKDEIRKRMRELRRQIDSYDDSMEEVRT